MDLDKGRRYGTLEDFRNFIKLAQSIALAAPFRRHDLRAGRCAGQQAPSRHGLQPHQIFRPRLHGLDHGGEPRRGFDRHGAHRVRRDFVDENCVILGNVNVNSPLVWDGTMTKALRAYARANQAAVDRALHPRRRHGSGHQCRRDRAVLAETLAGCALTQLERPGAPVIFGNFLSSMSLRSGSPTFGTPEPAIGSMVIGQLARRLNLPLRCAGNFSNSKLPDGQAMQEGVMSMLSAVHCGANFILHSAGFLDGLLSMSYEKFVMDADFCGALHSYLAGVVVDDNKLAMDAFQEVGPGSHFLGCEHTMRNYQTAFWDSDICRQRALREVERGGRLDRHGARAPTSAGRRRWPNTRRRRWTWQSTRRCRTSWTRKKTAMADAWY